MEMQQEHAVGEHISTHFQKLSAFLDLSYVKLIFSLIKFMQKNINIYVGVAYMRIENIFHAKCNTNNYNSTHVYINLIKFKMVYKL